MDTVERLSLVALTAVQSIGTATIFKLISAQRKNEIDWHEFWVLPSDKLAEIGLSENQIKGIQLFKKEHTIYSYEEFLHFRHIRSIVIDDDEYPLLLKSCHHMPLVLFAQGRLINWKNHLSIAVVGTRHMTDYGKNATTKITTELVSQDAIIVSGFMYGVDCQAHQVCLDNNGITVGVLGYGFDHCYPRDLSARKNEWQSQSMCFYSPFAPHVRPSKGTFPARNVLVAGMSHAVVVTEAGAQSGTHITAGHAVSENRVVCAVSGPFNSPYAQGTKELINQGALLVSSGQEVIKEIQSHFSLLPSLSAEATAVYAQLLQQPMYLDQLYAKLDLNVKNIQVVLTELEIKGLANQKKGQWSVN